MHSHGVREESLRDVEDVKNSIREFRVTGRRVSVFFTIVLDYAEDI